MGCLGLYKPDILVVSDNLAVCVAKGWFWILVELWFDFNLQLAGLKFSSLIFPGFVAWWFCDFVIFGFEVKCLGLL